MQMRALFALPSARVGLMRVSVLLAQLRRRPREFTR
jgi:hypothetical protein